MSRNYLIFCPVCNGFIAQIGISGLYTSTTEVEPKGEAWENAQYLKQLLATMSEKERSCDHCGFVGKIRVGGYKDDIDADIYGTRDLIDVKFYHVLLDTPLIYLQKKYAHYDLWKPGMSHRELAHAIIKRTCI